MSKPEAASSPGADGRLTIEILAAFQVADCYISVSTRLSPFLSSPITFAAF